MSNYGPKDFWQVKKEGNLKFNDALKPGDKRYIDLAEARGDNVYNRLLRPLGFEQDFTPALIEKDENHYVLFCGHRGCGKSTELNIVAEKLHRPDGYFTVKCNIVEDLDLNNIEYVDILFLVARKIAEELEKTNISINQKHIEDLKDFFKERIVDHVKKKDFQAEIQTGLESKLGFEFIGAIFAKFTSAFKTGSTYTELVRNQVKNQFTLFKTIFNRMLAEIKNKIEEKKLGKSLLVIIDGTDRLTRQDCDRIFLNHASQLTQLETNFIYTVPIHLVYESNQVKNYYDAPFVLPNVIVENEQGIKNETGRKAMKELVYRRIHPDLFDSEKTVEYIVDMSGGHVRELLHILQGAFNMAKNNKFDRAAVDEGIKMLKADYMRILNAEGYQRLVKLFLEKDKESDEIIKTLLFNSVVLEYDDYWRCVNPVVKETEEFRRFLKEYANIP